MSVTFSSPTFPMPSLVQACLSSTRLSVLNYATGSCGGFGAGSFVLTVSSVVCASPRPHAPSPISRNQPPILRVHQASTSSTIFLVHLSGHLLHNRECALYERERKPKRRMTPLSLSYQISVWQVPLLRRCPRPSGIGIGGWLIFCHRFGLCKLSLSHTHTERPSPLKASG